MPEYKIKLSAVYTEKVHVQHDSPEAAIRAAKKHLKKKHPDMSYLTFLDCKELTTK